MPEPEAQPKPQPIDDQPSGLNIPKKRSTRNILLWVSGATLIIILGAIVSGIIWYNTQLSPVGGDISQLKEITIDAGSTPSQIGKKLKEQSIIRNALAFDIYIRLADNKIVLQAGTYRLSPAETTPQIVEHFVKGSVNQFSITFYPGATLTDTTNKSKKYDITTVLKSAGYSDSEIATALGETYSGPLFDGKPANTGLEGYIYGETYNFNVGATVKDILQATFDEFYKVVQDNNLVKDFADHGLNLYQGITLASIIQREVSKPEDQKQAAQIFYSRLDLGMNLGSDVTYQYIADKTGVPRDTNLDSPYNTRRYPGLPPGPIAVPGLTALQVVAQPAEGDYLYFLSGDDGKTYFAHTDAEHEANIVNYCKEACSTP
jgi:UPF0755 protein